MFFNSNCQKIADYLSAKIVPFEEFRNAIDSRELWRGEIQIRERKVNRLLAFTAYSKVGLSTSFSVQLTSAPVSLGKVFYIDTKWSCLQ